MIIKILKYVLYVLVSVASLIFIVVFAVYLRYQHTVSQTPGQFKVSFQPGEMGKWVNPFIGTGGFPAYTGGDNHIIGFSHTRLIGTGAWDGGHFRVVPSVGEKSLYNYNRGKYNRFSHKSEIAFPGYYAVWFHKQNILAELTATERIGVHRYTFSGNETPHILIDVSSSLGFYPAAGSDVYQIGAPIFEKATLKMGENILQIETKNFSPENKYVQKVWINDVPLDRWWFAHEEIQQGGKIVFEMAEKPTIHLNLK